uniref:Uncharacterized protein n=1 Tax=uncultured marine virus TaxID=186617 RepID=A0A0F7L689_9VIRU|nr:hypothetical protein [uncultured marine virus]
MMTRHSSLMRQQSIGVASAWSALAARRSLTHSIRSHRTWLSMRTSRGGPWSSVMPRAFITSNANACPSHSARRTIHSAMLPSPMVRPAAFRRSTCDGVMVILIPPPA